MNTNANTKMFILVDVIFYRKIEKKGEPVKYMTVVDSSKAVKAEDGEEIMLPEAKTFWLDEALPRGQHLLWIEVFPSKKSGIVYKVLKRVDDPSLVKALAEVK